MGFLYRDLEYKVYRFSKHLWAWPKEHGKCYGFLAYSVENTCLWEGPANSQMKCFLMGKPSYLKQINSRVRKSLGKAPP